MTRPTNWDRWYNELVAAFPPDGDKNPTILDIHDVWKCGAFNTTRGRFRTMVKLGYRMPELKQLPRGALAYLHRPSLAKKRQHRPPEGVIWVTFRGAQDARHGFCPHCGNTLSCMRCETGRDCTAAAGDIFCPNCAYDPGFENWEQARFERAKARRYAESRVARA